MSNSIYSFDAEHQGIVVRYPLNKHDARYDYYGKRVATAGSDGKINIFDVTEDSVKKIAELAK